MKEFVKKKAVIVKDRLGLPNYMTMFYMEPGTYKEEDVPEMFKIRNKIVPAILISQYHNTVIDILFQYGNSKTYWLYLININKTIY